MKRILIVDDIEENLYLLRVLLEGHNYLVDEARNGSEAIVMAQKSIPDLIISDILMPVIDGYTLCRIWKADERFSRVPFIFYTATYTDPRDEKLALDIGADAFIIKPAEPEEFMRKVEEILSLDKEGKFTAPQKPKAGNEHILKNYSEALIRKLEQKMAELEKLNKVLESEIAEKNKIESTLRDSEEKYRLIFENSLDAFFLTSPDGTVLSANPAACRMFGMTVEEIKAFGRNCLFAVMDHRLEEAIRIRAETGHFNGELTAFRKDGTEFPVEISSLVFTDGSGRKRTSTIVKDITDRKRTEQLTQIRLELHEYSASHTIEEIAVRTLDVLEVLTASSIGFFHFMVPGEKTLSLQAWSTRTVREFCTAEGKGLHYSIEQAGVWVDCVRERKTVIHNDYPSLPHRKGLPEGHAPVIRELIVPIFRSDNIVAILGLGNKSIEYNERDAETVSYLSDIAWDIISRKQAEIHLQEMYNNLEDIVKLRTSELEKVNKELEAFSYTVSHDLRAPLRHIMGFIDMFRAESGSNISEKALHYTDVIRNSAKHMGQLIDDLLSFSRMQRTALSMEVVNMDEIADNVLQNFSEEIIKNGIFTRRNPLPAVMGDKAMLNVMFTNLISNAVKFTSKSEKRLVEIGYEPGKKLFFIRDTGAGFDMKYADKLFGVFHRLHSDKEFEGTGIGLATVKKIIERHGGSISAESEPGKGTCFYFSLPLAGENN